MFIKNYTVLNTFNYSKIVPYCSESKKKPEYAKKILKKIPFQNDVQNNSGCPGRAKTCRRNPFWHRVGMLMCVNPIIHWYNANKFF